MHGESSVANNNLIVAAAVKYLGTYDGPRDFNSIVLAAANKYLGADPKRRSLNGAVLAALNKYTTVDGKSLNSAIRNACIQYGITGRSLNTIIDKAMVKYINTPVGNPPVNTALPVVSGTPSVGSVLSCTTGTWTGDPTIVYTYHWRRDGVNISGATASTYTLVSADLGTLVSCSVTATNSAGTQKADSNSLGPVTSGTDVTPDPIYIPNTSGNAVPGTSGGSTRYFTVTGINVPITLSVKRSGQAQTGSPTTNRIDIYTKPSGGSFALATQLGSVPGAVKTFSVSNGTEVALDWLFETASGPASASFTFHLENGSAGNASLATANYSLSLLG